MAITNTVPAGGQTPADTPKPNAETKAEGRNEVFDNLTHMLASVNGLTDTTRQRLEDTAKNERVIDVSGYTSLADSARVHLTQNGSMLLSYTQDGMVYNHQMTTEERNKLNSVLTNEKMSKIEQIYGISSVFSNISMASHISTQLDETRSQTQNIGNSFHR